MISPTGRRGDRLENGSWKIIWIFGRSARSSVRAEIKISLPLKSTSTAGLLAAEAEHRPARGGLAAAGLADEAHRAAALEVERHTVDGLDVANGLSTAGRP